VHLLSSAVNKKQCPDCLRYIPNASFMMHTIQCARAKSACEICKAFVSPNLMQQHLESHHLTPCSLCGAKVD